MAAVFSTFVKMSRGIFTNVKPASHPQRLAQACGRFATLPERAQAQVGVAFREADTLSVGLRDLVSLVMSLHRGSTLVAFAGGLLLLGEQNGWRKLPAVVGIFVGIALTVLGWAAGGPAARNYEPESSGE
jgi:hypothetical protein